MLARIFGYGNSTESSTFLVFLRFGSVEFSILAKCRSNQTRCQQHWGCVARALNSAALIHKVQLIQSPEEACVARRSLRWVRSSAVRSYVATIWFSVGISSLARNTPDYFEPTVTDGTDPHVPTTYTPPALGGPSWQRPLMPLCARCLLLASGVVRLGERKNARPHRPRYRATACSTSASSSRSR